MFLGKGRVDTKESDGKCTQEVEPAVKQI